MKGACAEFYRMKPRIFKFQASIRLLSSSVCPIMSKFVYRGLRAVSKTTCRLVGLSVNQSVSHKVLFVCFPSFYLLFPLENGYRF